MNLVARNTTKTNTIALVGEDSFGSSGYEIKGTDNQNQPLKRMHWYECDGLIYPLSRYQCKPGQEIREQVILQKFCEFPRAGTYSVSCMYRTILGPRITSERSCMKPNDIPIYSKTGKVDYQTNKWVTVSKKFNIVVKPFDEQKVITVATQLIARLSVPDIKTLQDTAIGSAYCFDSYSPDSLLPISDIKTRLDAVKALAYFSGSDGVCSNVIVHLLPVLLDTNEKVQEEALQSLNAVYQRAGKEKAVAVLQTLLNDPNVKMAAALGKCTIPAFGKCTTLWLINTLSFGLIQCKVFLPLPAP